MSDNNNMSQHARQQQQHEEKAFDPFAPSPVNVPSSSLQNSRSTSPYFNNDAGFPIQQHQEEQNHLGDSGGGSVLLEEENFVYDTHQEEEDDEDLLDNNTNEHGMNHNNYDFEYHTDKDESSTLGSSSQKQQRVATITTPQGSVHSGLDENQTVSSEQALQGTPIRKKDGTTTLKPKSGKKHRRKGNKGKVIIDNVDEQNIMVQNDKNNVDESL